MNPFGWVTERAQPCVLVGLLLLLVVLTVWLTFLGRELVTPEAPLGIVSYELAEQLDRSDSILRSWSTEAKAAAMLILGLDFLYLLVYPACFSLAAALLGARLGGGWRQVASVVAWVALAAAPLDAVENLALIQQLIHGPSAVYAPLAWWCAIPKFASVVIAGAFLALAGSVGLLARLRAA
jgi:hypothetical protein